MSCWKQGLSSLFWYMDLESPILLNFCILSLLFVNYLPQALYVNPGYLECISGINLSPANKNLLTISFILHLALTC